MEFIKSRETLKREAVKDSKVFLYSALKSVEMGGDIDVLLNIINSMEGTLKQTQEECMKLYRERSLESYRTEALFTSHIISEGISEKLW